MNSQYSRRLPESTGRRSLNGHRSSWEQVPAYEASGGSATLDLVAIAGALRNQWRLLAAALAGATLLAVAYTALKTPVYQAYGVVLVRTSQASRPTGPIEEVLPLQHMARTIDNELGMLRQSLLLAERVVERVPQAVLTDDHDAEEPITPVALARNLLEERVRFDVIGENMDMIRISATASDARQAAQIAQVYVDEYLKHSREVNTAGAVQSRTFLEEQVEKRREELQRLEHELVEFMEQERAVALDAESEQAVAQAAFLEAEREATRVDLEVERASLRELEREVARIEPGLQRRIGSSAEHEIAQLQALIAQLEVQANDYYALDPSLRGSEERNADLAVLTARIAEARRVLEERSVQLIDEVFAAGGVDSEDDAGGLVYISQLRRSAVEKSIRVQGLATKLEALDAQLEAHRVRMQALPGQRVRLAQLQRSQKAAEQMYLLLSSKLQEARIAEESQIGYAALVRPVTVPEKPVAPILWLNLLIGASMGLFLGAAFILLRRAFVGPLQTPDDVRAIGLPVLAVVQQHPAGQLHAGRTQTAGLLSRGERLQPAHGEARLDLLASALESFRYLRTSIRWNAANSQTRAVMVASAVPGEGKTSIALNLTGAMAQAGLRVLYLDADMRRPTSRKRLGIAGEQGLSDLLAGGGIVDWDEYRCPVRVANGRGDEILDGMYVLPAGHATGRSTELLESERMREVMSQAVAEFDIVIVDTPPLLAVADPVLVARHCDAVLFVVGAGKVTRDMVRRALDRLAPVHPDDEALLGVVLNGVDERTGRAAAYGYAYDYSPSFEPAWDHGRPSRGGARHQEGGHEV